MTEDTQCVIMSNKLRQDFRLLWRGLFLEPDAYHEVAEDDNPFVQGLYLVVIVGVIVGVANLVGTLLDWATTPNLEQMKQTILQGLQAMPWFQGLRDNPDAFRMFQQQYNLGWQIANFFTPKPASGLLTLVTTPVGLIVSWLWFGLIAHAVARLLGSKAKLGETLGASALAVAPILLNVFGFLPTVVVAGIGVWTLLARFVAIRRVHEQLTWVRALIAVFVPPILLGFVIAILAALAIPVMGVLSRGMMQ